MPETRNRCPVSTLWKSAPKEEASLRFTFIDFASRTVDINGVTELTVPMNPRTEELEEGQRELPRLDYFHGGVNYRLPPPGATIEDGMKANVAFPGLTIRYILEGSEPTVESNEYTKPVPVRGVQAVKLHTFDPRGRDCRTVMIGKIIKY